MRSTIQHYHFDIMGRRWLCLLALVFAVVPVRPQTYIIETTWNGEQVDHAPIQLTLDGSTDGEYLELSILAPFFGDPAAPSGEPGKPFFGLWNYEVVEAFFLNDENQYLEVEVSPYGQHIVLLLNGQRNTIRHSLPLEVNTTIDDNITWSGFARIPVGYLPKNTTKFNAYGIHGSGENRTYESLFPADENATQPDFHALEFFQEIDMSLLLPEHEAAEMSELWEDSIIGIFRYRIETTWDGVPIDHRPYEITLQGYTGGVEFNVTAPFFNDPAPDRKPGNQGKLYKHEIVEMYFLNDENEYLQVQLGPFGHYLVLLLKGVHNELRRDLTLDFIVEERTEPSGGNPGVWRGSAMIPPSYFPPRVNKMNANAMHGLNESRQYLSLYPAPNNDPEYPGPNFHALELFQPIDFEYQVTKNNKYSQIWEDAISSGSSSLSLKSDTTEQIEDVTAQTSQFSDDSSAGINRYRIETTWDGLPIDHRPYEITLQGLTEGVEVNVTAPFFNDPAPDGKPGKPFSLWKHETVEMYFLNDENEYLQVQLGPFGQYYVLLLKGVHNRLRRDLTLDFIVEKRTEPSGGNPGVWRGSTVIPPSYFPPRVNKMNANAMHGLNESRQHLSLYPAPNNDPEYPEPNFHALELFQPIDFGYLVTNNNRYSQFWIDAINSGSSSPSLISDTTEQIEDTTMLGPAKTEDPVTIIPSNFKDEFNENKVHSNAQSRIPKPEQISIDELSVQDSQFSIPPVRNEKITPEIPRPQPIRIGNREFSDSKQNVRGNRVQSNRRKILVPSSNSRQPSTPVREQERPFQNQPSQPTEVFQQRTPFTNEGRFPARNPSQTQNNFLSQQGGNFVSSPLRGNGQRISLFQNQGESQPEFVTPQFVNQNSGQQQPSVNQNQQSFLNRDQQTIRIQGQKNFPNHGQQTFQNQAQQTFPLRGQQGQQVFQNQDQQVFQNEGQQVFQNQNQQILQNEEQQLFQNQNQQTFQNPNQQTFQSQDQQVFQNQGQQVLQNQNQQIFQNQRHPAETSSFQNNNSPTVPEEESINPFADLPGSESTNTGLQDTVTPEVEQAVLTLAEGVPALPPPHPICFEPGLVPDPDRCFAFHECTLESGQWQIYSWRCRRGQIFDPINVACVRGRCPRSQTRRRRVRGPVQ